MQGNLLDIYGKYDTALKNYINQANAYNTAGNAWNKSVEDYNNSIISDQSAYSPQTGNYAGSGPYTYYNGYTIGRTGTPISTYQTSPAGYNTVTDYNNLLGYDYEGSPYYGTSQVPYYSGTNETTYVDPNTGLASIFAPRPSSTFDMVAPTAPTAPPEQTMTNTLGSVDPSQLYQSLYGKATPDVMSNEAWSLQNISTPFLSSENSAYETGGVNRMNNPLYSAEANELTSGPSGKDINSYISGQQTGNVYY